MKTLLKNRRSYQHRIGLPDVQDNSNLKDISGEKSDEEGQWDEMYLKDDDEGNGDKNGSGSEGEDEDEDGNRGEDEDGNRREDEDGNCGEGVHGDEDGNRGEGGYEDEDEEFGAKYDEGRNGEGSSSAKLAGKRKATQDDAPTTTTRSQKKIKATQPTKKAVPKGKQSKK